MYYPWHPRPLTFPYYITTWVAVRWSCAVKKNGSSGDLGILIFKCILIYETIWSQKFWETVQWPNPMPKGWLHFGHAIIQDGFVTVDGMLKLYLALWKNLKCDSLISSQRICLRTLDHPSKIHLMQSGSSNTFFQDLKVPAGDVFYKLPFQVPIETRDPIFPRWDIK